MMGPSGRKRRERELDEEITTHLEMAIRDRIGRGESRAAAERAVRREFGDVGRVKEVTRRMWGWGWLDRFLQDVAFGLRSFVRDPGFAVAAVLILAVGIGANAVVFTIADGFLYDDPPAVADPERLVGLRWIGEDGTETHWSYTDYQFVREHAAGFSGVLSYMAFPTATAIGTGQGSAQANTWAVSDNYFGVLGVDMSAGRGFLPEEGQTPGSPAVAVISEGFRDHNFGRDAQIVGQTIRINDTPFSVVGVAPAGLGAMSPTANPPDLYVPLMMQGVLVPGAEAWFARSEGHVTTWVQVVGRLRDGVSLEGAQADLDLLESAWQDEFGGWAASNELAPFRFVASPDYRFAPGEGERVRRMLALLAGTVATLLLIGCANLAILLLARASGRRGEFGVRAALGAGRLRLLRQLLTESWLLASLGGLGGFLLAYLSVGGVAALLPYSLPVGPRPDGTVLVYTAGVTVLVTVLFGLLPAFRLSRTDISSVLRNAGRSTRRSRTRHALVIGQIAACMVLLTGAGLFVRSLTTARSVDLGFDPENKLFLTVELANHGYDEASGRIFIQEVLDRARGMPSVGRATVVGRPPFSGASRSRYLVPGTPLAEDGANLFYNVVGPDYFASMGIPIVAGRPIALQDDAGAPRAAVVNETVAERLWPGEEAVGRTLARSGVEWTIVGVAANATYFELGETQYTQLYLPYVQEYLSSVTFLVETIGPPEDVMPTVQELIRSVDPAIAILGTQTLADLVEAQMGGYRILAILVTVFGLMALLLAAAGLYGVQSYLVGQQTREIGIRLALGAGDRQVARSVLRQGSMLAAIGLLIGTTVALGAGAVVQSMLFEVSPTDPATFVIALTVVLSASILASYLPARRASQVDPNVALRHE